MPVDTDYSIVFPTGLAVFEELLSGRCGEFLIVSSVSIPSPFYPVPFDNLAEDRRIHRRESRLTITSATAPSLDDCSSLDQTTPFWGFATYQLLLPSTILNIPAMRTLGLESEDILDMYMNKE